MKKSRLQELAGLREVADKRPTELEKAKYTDEEMLTRTTANQFPTNFTILDIIERYEEYVIGYLKDQGKLNEGSYIGKEYIQPEDLAKHVVDKLIDDKSLTQFIESLSMYSEDYTEEPARPQHRQMLEDVLINILRS